MALVLANRVQETTTTTGTGTITLAGAVAGFQSFAVIGNGNTTYYTITSGTAWEVGIGTYSTAGPTLARTTILSSSAGGAAITLAGTSAVFVTYPSDRAVTTDGTETLTNKTINGSNNTITNVSLTSAVTGTLPVANGGTGVTTSTGTTSVVLSNSPVLVTPTLGVASATSIATGLGAVGTPSHTFTGDTNTGMWSPGADTIAFSEGGVEAMRIDSSGNVGIGTTAPLAQLNVTDSILVTNNGGYYGGQAYFASGSWRNAVTGQGGYAIRNTSGVFTVYTGASTSAAGTAFTDFAERMRIASDGTTTLSVGGVSNTHQFIYNESGGEIQLVDSTGAGPILIDNSGGLARFYKVGTGAMSIGTTGANYLQFITNSAERMRIASDGNVGIGTSSPAQRLHVATTAAPSGTTQSFLRATADVGFGADFGGGIIQGVGPIATISTVSSGTATERMRITSAGNVGIGTTAPIGPLQVVGGGYFGSSSSQTTGTCAIYNDGNNVTIEAFAGNNTATKRNILLATYGGNVGIGTSAPVQRLHVRQDQDGTTAALIQNRNGSGTPISAIQFISGAFDLSDNRYAMISSAGGSNTTLQFWTGSGATPTERMRITSAGNVGIGTTAPTTIFHVQQNTTANIGMRMRQLSTTQFAGAGLLCNGPVSSGVQGGTAFYHYNRNTGGTNGALAMAQFDENGSFQRSLAEYYYNEQAWLFYTNGSERLRIDSSGNVGIGTSSPGAKLDVSSSASNIVASRSTGGYAAFQRIAPAGQFTYDFYTINGVEAGRITVTDTNIMAFSTGSAAAERMRITSAGKVGIGTSSPDATAILDVSSTTAGFLPPRMSTAERDAIGGGAPQEGLILYNVTTDKLQVFSAGAWVNLH